MEVHSVPGMFVFLLVFVYVMASQGVSRKTMLTKEDLNITKFLPDEGKPDTVYYFRLLKLNKNDNYLYVGAKNQVIRLNLTDINDAPKIFPLAASKAEVDECVKQGKKEEPDCQNHIRVVELVHQNDLLVCGTGAYNPKQYRLKASSLTLYEDENYTTDGKGICPYDPFDSVVSLLSEDRNAAVPTMIYTGVYHDFLKTDPSIMRQPLFFSPNAQGVPKIKTGPESDWLNQPHFVGGSDVGDEVLFFFREEGNHCLRKDRQTFSRVAKVCKSDPGHYQMYWLSYQKTRIFCRMPGDHEDFYQIQDVAEVNDMFYALFTKDFEAIKASVVCSFTKNVILNSFRGKYQLSCSINGRISSSTAADSMSRTCDVFRNKTHGFNGLYKKENLLMEQELRGSNVFYVKDVIYTDIEVVFNKSGKSDTKIFAAANDGHIHEISFKSQVASSDKPISDSRIYNIFNGTEEVRSIKMFGDQLYVCSDYSVVQVNIRCTKHATREDCKSDPSCAWCTSRGCMLSDQTTCLDGNVENVTPTGGIHLNNSDGHYIRLKTVDLKVDLGSVNFLEINQTVPNSQLKWYFNDTYISLDNPNLELTTKNTLVIKNTGYENQGYYTAIEITGKNAYRSEVHLSVIDNSPLIRWERAFRDWSVQFEKVKQCNQCCV